MRVVVDLSTRTERAALKGDGWEKPSLVGTPGGTGVGAFSVVGGGGELPPRGVEAARVLCVKQATY